VPGAVNRIYVWITDGSTNGTYVNGIRVMRGEPVQLCPDDHVTLLKRDNSSDSRPNIGFRIIMALEKPKMEDHYTILRNDILGTYPPSLIILMTVVPSVQFIKQDISRPTNSSPSKSSDLSAAQV
jgi:pSer/pThr/pTyr-binding forkhead associated (FHA) protein